MMVRHRFTLDEYHRLGEVTEARGQHYPTGI